MRLPESFENRMREYFQRKGIPSEGFFESFDNEPLKGIRINRNKVAPEEYEDVKGLVVADYQEELEKAWVADLRRKYSFKVNQDVLKTVNKH